MILGAVLAGGQSTRFGSDKALAVLGGHTLLSRAADLLSGWCEYVVVVGREVGPAPTLPDWPRPGMGPLAGLAAALHLARDEDYEAVLTMGVDSLNLPENLPDLLTPASSYIESQPVVGLWSAGAIQSLEGILMGDGKHSMLAFANMIDARPVKPVRKPANINSPADLAEAEKRRDL